MNVSTAVVDRIRLLCKEQKITPNALSRKAGISQSTIKSILVGESMSPGVLTIKKLCDGFGITIPEFFDTDVFKSMTVGKGLEKPGKKSEKRKIKTTASTLTKKAEKSARTPAKTTAKPKKKVNK